MSLFQLACTQVERGRSAASNPAADSSQVRYVTIPDAFDTVVPTARKTRILVSDAGLMRLASQLAATSQHLILDPQAVQHAASADFVFVPADSSQPALPANVRAFDLDTSSARNRRILINQLAYTLGVPEKGAALIQQINQKP